MELHEGFTCQKCNRACISLNKKNYEEIEYFKNVLCGYHSIKCCKAPMHLDLCTDCINIFLNTRVDRNSCTCKYFLTFKLYECGHCGIILPIDNYYKYKSIPVTSTRIVNIYFDTDNIPICGHCIHKYSSLTSFNKNISQLYIKTNP